MVLRNAKAWTAALVLASLAGCASSRSGTNAGPVSPQMARTTPRAEPQVGSDQLIHIGDTLRMQGKYRQAAEVYSWVLKREPNNGIVRQRMAMLPPTVVNEPQDSAPFDRQAQRPEYPSTSVSPQQSPPPQAPGTTEDLPAYPGAPPAPRSVPPAPGVSDSAMTPFHVSSGMPTTLVRSTGGSEPENTYTIQVIPASKGKAYQVQELRVSEGDSTAAPGSSSNPQGTPNGSARSNGLPTGLRELATYINQPQQHVPNIARRLRDDSPDVRSLAAFLLGRAGESAVAAVPVLGSLLNSEQNGPTQIRISEALLRISPQHEPALRILLAGLSSPERAVRWEAVCVSDVVKTPPHSTAVVSKLIDRLEDVDGRIRIMAALKLGDVRADKALAVAALEKLLHNPESSDELKDAARISLAALRSREKAVVKQAHASTSRTTFRPTTKRAGAQKGDVQPSGP